MKFQDFLKKIIDRGIGVRKWIKISLRASGGQIEALQQSKSKTSFSCHVREKNPIWDGEIIVRLPMDAISLAALLLEMARKHDKEDE